MESLEYRNSETLTQIVPQITNTQQYPPASLAPARLGPGVRLINLYKSICVNLIGLEGRYNTQKKISRIRRKPPPHAPAITAKEVAFSDSASFLYFLLISVKFWLLFSSSLSTAPLCNTSSMFCTMILCTSCNSVFKLDKFLLPLVSL